MRLEFLVDEGDYTVTDGADFGAPGALVKMVELSEKGYCDVRLTVRSRGGHSSNPFGGTSLGTLAQAIARIAQAPYPVRLSPLVAATFEALAPRITQEPFASLVRGAGAGPEATGADARRVPSPPTPTPSRRRARSAASCSRWSPPPSRPT